MDGTFYTTFSPESPQCHSDKVLTEFNIYKGR